MSFYEGFGYWLLRFDRFHGHRINRKTDGLEIVVEKVPVSRFPVRMIKEL